MDFCKIIKINMNYVKIGLEEYNRLKKSHDALRASKKLVIRHYDSFEMYLTESEIVDELTKRVNLSEKMLENANKDRDEKSKTISILTYEVDALKLQLEKPKSFWSIFKK